MTADTLLRDSTTAQRVDLRHFQFFISDTVFSSVVIFMTQPDNFSTALCNQ